MSRSIKISEKHGVNPTIPLCFWCGREKNEIALLGKLPKDAEAPMHVILDYEPCDECEANMALGVTCIEVSPEPVHGNLPPLSGMYPTGNWIVVRTEAIERMITDPDMLAAVKAKGKCMLDQATFHAWFGNVSDD